MFGKVRDILGRAREVAGRVRNRIGTIIRGGRAPKPGPVPRPQPPAQPARGFSTPVGNSSIGSAGGQFRTAFLTPNEAISYIRRTGLTGTNAWGIYPVENNDGSIRYDVWIGDTQ